MPHGAQKLFEILSTHWSAVFLFAKHHCIIEVENDSPIQGQREKDRLVTLESGGGLLTLIFIAPQSVFDSYQPAFEAMLRSLSVG